MAAAAKQGPESRFTGGSPTLRGGSGSPEAAQLWVAETTGSQDSGLRGAPGSKTAQPGCAQTDSTVCSQEVWGNQAEVTGQSTPRQRNTVVNILLGITVLSSQEAQW